MHALGRIGIVAMIVVASMGVARPATVTRYTGMFSDGATYLIQAPSNWNGTLLLFSHGYIIPGQPNPAVDTSDPVSGKYLLAHGYALAGSSYASTGWAVADALPDQMNVLTAFGSHVGTPRAVIAWGKSMGGLITAGLIQQYPASFAAALPLCGAIGGSVGTWNTFLDTAFAFNTLLAAGGLQVVNIANPAQNYSDGVAILNAAQQSPAGRARTALAAALGDIPGWYYERSQQPGATNAYAQEQNQFLWLQQDDLYFGLDLRAELERRAGGNPSWNAGIDYSQQLALSADRAEVTTLYAKAGLNLATDLNALDAAATISANPSALTYLSNNIILDGALTIPVLTVQTEGDGLVVDEADSAYAAAVNAAGDGAALRETFVARAGHCAFTPGETLAAFEALVNRLNSGQWGGLDPATLNGVAQGLGAPYNPFPPAYSAFTPGAFLRTDNGMPLRRTPFTTRAARSMRPSKG